MADSQVAVTIFLGDLLGVDLDEQLQLTKLLKHNYVSF
jgi:hypothetical protein